MEELRERVREITLKLIDLYSERLRLVEEIGKIKREDGAPLRDLRVEQELWKEVKERCKEKGLDDWNCSRLFSFIIAASIRAQIPEGGDAGPHLEVFRKAKRLEKGGVKIYHLEVGEPPWSFPSWVLDEMIKAVEEGRTRYGTSLGSDRFRKAASEWIKRRDGIDSKPENVIVTPGSKFAIYSILACFLKPGDRVGVMIPAWPAYRGMASNLGLEFIEVTSLDDLWKLRGIRAFIVCSPNNPDGKVWRRSELEELADFLNENDALLISDDAYAEISLVDRFPPTKAYERSLSVNTLSKAFGMTGFRVGYINASESMISALSNYMSLTISNVPEFIQEASAVALERGESYVNEVKEVLRAYLRRALNDLSGAPLEYEKPQGGLYIFPRVDIDGFDSMEFASRVLEEKGIAIAPGSGFGPFKEWIRVTFASEGAEQGLKLLKEALLSWRS
ncbi:MAG: aminotransferase class I/II-fold pyridoxal phosphate-dependent enzyme [Candidatus Korarchaeum sp.]|nr:aminotransferase class I/II-fold pyridoxal phosphate-dependent enzyme [Candidatus Korarchaeum sp.]MDW8035771.1 aminotransferase class I/II-fold pyridoxal phosphate-dependent enzyme [Candidatus Korarchaeum sp.]